MIADYFIENTLTMLLFMAVFIPYAIFGMWLFRVKDEKKRDEA